MAELASSDFQGKPIPQAEAQLYLHSGKWGFPVYWKPPAATDGQGAFRIADLPADRAYFINFGAPGYGSFQEGDPHNSQGRVAAEGFSLDELEAKLQLLPR